MTSSIWSMMSGATVFGHGLSFGAIPGVNREWT